MHDAAIIGLLRRGHALRPQNSRLQTLKVLAVPPPVLLIELPFRDLHIATSRHSIFSQLLELALLPKPGR